MVATGTSSQRRFARPPARPPALRLQEERCSCRVLSLRSIVFVLVCFRAIRASPAPPEAASGDRAKANGRAAASAGAAPFGAAAEDAARFQMQVVKTFLANCAKPGGYRGLCELGYALVPRQG